MSRPRVAVVFGGRSAEHAISCVSAGSVLAALDRNRYDVVAVGITPDGRFLLAADDPAALAITGRRLPAVAETGSAVNLVGDRGELGPVDVVFPVLHGPYGEDGTVQGLLELAGIPYVGSGVLASAAAMDKEYMKLLLVARGLPVGDHVVLRRGTPYAGVLDRLGLPAFVKPARGGSSLGISKVRAAEELPGALEAAWRHDPKALVETALPGREIECGVLDGPVPGRPEASLPAEIHVTGGQEFYDFEAKYLDDATAFDVPADLDPATTARVRELACRAFAALGCEGLARVDFFLQPDGSLVVNEVNTMPGFTPASMFPRMWAATGLDYPALLDRLVAGALARGTGLR